MIQTQLSKENRERLRSLQTQCRTNIALKPNAHAGERNLIPYGPVLWMDFTRFGPCYVSPEILKKFQLNIFRDPVPRGTFRAVEVDTVNDSDISSAWRELDLFVNSKKVSTWCPSTKEERFVASGIEALISGAPGIRRWRHERRCKRGAIVGRSIP